MSSVRVDVYNVLARYPRARDDVNVCITKYFVVRGIKHVSPRLWGRADTVRREWRYWMNTKQAFPSSTKVVRARASELIRDYYSTKEVIW